MEQLQRAGAGELLPSIAVGHLGPPKLTKLLAEAFLLREAVGTDDLEAMRQLTAKELQASVEDYLGANPKVVSQIVTIGIPILRETNGELRLTRGPRINIPPTPPDGAPVTLAAGSAETYANSGWVDLRLANFDLWSSRLTRLADACPDIVKHGSAAFEVAKYISDRFVPGDVVGWLFNHEVDEQGIAGHRLF